ncbi:MAG: RluA family pseudouridine synthase [Treponema sp.]|nr:RluA family pseudouridine synthase [Treponema sp.]
MELITGENDKGRRLDRILRKALADHPLPFIHRLLRQKKVLVNGKAAKADDRLDSGMKICIPSLPGSHYTKPKKERLTETVLPSFEILWQGQGLLAVNKPPGLAVHGTDSLESIIRNYLKDKLPESLSFKPGPLHRLDKPSSGVVVFSSSLDGARLFSALLREQKIRKTYLAVVKGNLEDERIWEDILIRDSEKKKTFISGGQSGKNAVTKVTPLKHRGNLTLIKAEISTGRTHQIRAQSASHGHPLAGDVKYGGGFSGVIGGFFLHAWKLEFLDFVIEAPLPEDRERLYSEEVTALLECVFKFL